MGMYYSMILVPADPHSSPEPARFVAFLGGMLELGAAGQVGGIFVRDYQNAKVTRFGRNPRTGETIGHRTPATIRLDSIMKLPEAIQGLTDFDAVIQGTGPARVLPLRNVGGYDNGEWRPLTELIASGTYTDAYALSVECSQRSKLISTSDLHEETETDRTAEPFGEPCELGDRVGLYSNPETVELITVPNTGCSTFWIAFKLGKWIFPKFAEKKIDFAEPAVLKLAETAFGTEFAEGCVWG